MTLHWCGVYTRQSREAEGEYSSCQAQFEACLAFAIERLEPARWICSHRYEDAGESGESLDRPGLQRMLSDVRAGVIERVLVHRLDRLSRRLTDCVEILTRFRDCGVPLTIVTEPELGSTASDALALNLLASFAEFEQEMHRDRLTEARAALKARGRRVAGLVPFGYVSDPVTKQLLIDPTEADVVVTMFRWAASGHTPAEIAELANERGWRTKRRVSKRDRESGGHPWTPRQVVATLENPVYVAGFATGTAAGRDCTRRSSTNRSSSRPALVSSRVVPAIRGGDRGSTTGGCADSSSAERAAGR